MTPCHPFPSLGCRDGLSRRRTFGSRRRWRPSRRAQRGAACDRPSALRAFGVHPASLPACPSSRASVRKGSITAVGADRLERRDGERQNEKSRLKIGCQRLMLHRTRTRVRSSAAACLPARSHSRRRAIYRPSFAHERLPAHLAPHRYPRVAGEHLEPATSVCFVFRTTTFSQTAWAQAGDDAREAAALRLNHLNTARRARLAGAGSRS